MILKLYREGATSTNVLIEQYFLDFHLQKSFQTLKNCCLVNVNTFLKDLRLIFRV